ncbi:MAG TPA: hypothetical protein VKS60_01360 [Stellaceae bacterium]|nr:hypothetical protein [Stellaceae bacterium]
MRRVSWVLAAVPAVMLQSAVLAAPPPGDDDDDNAPPAAAPSARPAAPAPAPPAPAPLPQPPPPPSPAALPLPAAGPASPETATLAADADRLHDNLARQEQAVATLHAERGTEAAAYYGLTGEIGRRLATGAAPADPDLTAKLAQAHTALDRLGSNTAQLGAVSKQLTEDAATALRLAGLVQQRLATQPADQAALDGVDAKIAATQAEIDRKLRELLAEIAREQRSRGAETANLGRLEQAVAAGLPEPPAAGTAIPPKAASDE